MLATGNQLKAARALIGLEQAQLAELAGIHINTVRRMEAAGPGPIAGRAVNVLTVQKALETAGVIFVAENGEGPGVRLRKDPITAALIRPGDGADMGPVDVSGARDVDQAAELVRKRKSELLLAHALDRAFVDIAQGGRIRRIEIAPECEQ